MRHGTIDQYAKKSRFFILDPRIKLIAIIIFVIVVSLLKEPFTLYFAFFFIIYLISISNIPINHFLKRYLLAFPFILFASISLLFSSNLSYSGLMFIRISTCVFALILLSSSTPFFDLLKAMQYLKIPNIILVLLMFTYRYFFVFIEEKERMKIARKARGFQEGSNLFDKNTMKVISYTIGMILIRAYERGIRIYDSLVNRGYTGKIKTINEMRLKSIDFIFCFILIFTSFLLFYYEWIVL